MKKNLFFLVLIILTGCRKEGLDVKFSTIYTSSQTVGTNLEKSHEPVKSGDYTQFGNFIGTITPGKVTAKFSSIRYVDKKSSTNSMQTMVEIISTNWADDDTRRFADFTNGNTVEAIPEMFGNIDNDGWFVEDSITLRYLGIFPQYFNFEFDLPGQFGNINLNFPKPDIVRREGNRLSCRMDYFLQHLALDLRGFVFGGTDTSYIVSQSDIPPGDIVDLISMAQPGDVARISNFTSPVLTPPSGGNSKVITTTISFDSHNLIRHYAGRDNNPYTFDDVFVFEPEFWERFNIIIDQN